MPRKLKQLSLFKTILLWVALSIVAYTLLSALWGHGSGWSRLFSGWQIDAPHDPLDRIKVTLTALGGIGAVGYLVIKYRERSALERGDADEKLVRAVQQLGDTSPQVRIAGVYALADVADTYEGQYHQRVVDILCGYLRTDRLLKDTNGNTRYATNEDGTPNYNHPLSADGPVESTILSVLANHLRSSPTGEEKHSTPGIWNTTPGAWSSCHIDIHNAYLTEKLRFNNTHITTINAQGTAFVGDVVFSAATFMQDANFDGTSFVNNASFWKATFMQEADFRDVTFQQNANFFAANLQQAAIFYHSIFAGTTEFKFAKFPASTNFKNAIFNINQQDSGHPIFKPDDIHLTQYGIPAESKWSRFEDGKPAL